MNKEQIRSLLDHLGVASRIDDDGDLAVTLEADNTFPHDVTIWIPVEDGRRLSFIAAASDFHPEGDLLLMANRNNRRRNYPTAVVRKGEIRMEYSFLVTEEVSNDFLTSCLRQQISGIWAAFSDFEKEDSE